MKWSAIDRLIVVSVASAALYIAFQSIRPGFGEWGVFIMVGVAVIAERIWTRVAQRPRLAPGHRILELSFLLFSKKTCARAVSPLVSDFREEYWDALASGHVLRRGLIRALFYISFGRTILHLVASNLVSSVGVAMRWYRD